jgi:hypothetical protein
MLSATSQHAAEPVAPIGQSGAAPVAVGFDNDQYMAEDELIDTAADLSMDDKKYLALK